MARPAVATPPGVIARRHALAAALTGALTGRPRRAAAAVDDAVAALLPPAFRATGRVLTVNPDTSLATVLATARDGDAVVLGPGEHSGRAVLERRVALIGTNAVPGTATTGTGPGVASTTCYLRWKTTNPYESTVAVRAPGCIVTGLTIAHASPSVANNYAVFVEGGADGFTLTNCAVTSATGTGVGVDAMTATLDRCTIKGCARYGVAVFGDGTRIVDCVIDGNRAGGVLVRAAGGVVVAGGARQRVEVVGGGEAVVDGEMMVG